MQDSHTGKHCFTDRMYLSPAMQLDFFDNYFICPGFQTSVSRDFHLYPSAIEVKRIVEFVVLTAMKRCIKNSIYLSRNSVPVTQRHHIAVSRGTISLVDSNTSSKCLFSMWVIQLFNQHNYIMQHMTEPHFKG